MCFNKTKESKILVAKRDIAVYKVGCFADEVRFYPYFMTTYMYSRKAPMRECVDFDRNSIDIGLHSLLSLQGVCDSWTRTENMLFFSNGTLYPFITTNVLYKHVYVGKFIIPKGSTYIVNCYNEVVSNTLVYTGKFKYINKNENFNVKELWKEK
jgi:hypothetical protein